MGEVLEFRRGIRIRGKLTPTGQLENALNGCFATGQHGKPVKIYTGTEVLLSNDRPPHREDDALVERLNSISSALSAVAFRLLGAPLSQQVLPGRGGRLFFETSHGEALDWLARTLGEIPDVLDIRQNNLLVIELGRGALHSDPLSRSMLLHHASRRFKAISEEPTVMPLLYASRLRVESRPGARLAPDNKELSEEA